MRVNIACGASLALLIVLSACGEQPAAPTKEAAPVTRTPIEELEAAVAENPLKEAYFGEQHIHTAYSLDAYIGGTRLTPFEAYDFAKGAEVEVNGIKHRLDRPLDWVAITDHAEYLGEMYTVFNARAPGHDQRAGQGPGCASRT